MNGHELQRHEETLARILTDEDALAAFEATPLASCATCRSLVREHVELATSLDALARTERREMRRALEGPEMPEGPAEQALRRALSPGGSRPGRSTSHRSWIAASAAAVLMFVLWIARSGSREDPGPELGTGLELLHPVHEVESFAPFRWNDEGPGAGWYRVVVFPLEAQGENVEPTDSGPVRDLSWTPPPEEVQRWGPYIRWTVEVYGGAGEGDLVDSEGTWARLSSR